MFTNIETYRSIFESFNDLPQRHAMLVHTPIAISLLGLLGLFALTCARGRSRTLRWSCVVLYLLGTTTAWMAREAGEDALELVDTTVLADKALEHLETHETMGEKACLWFLATAVITALTMIRGGHPIVRIGFLALPLLTGLATATYVGVTAHHGGILVYDHGIGIPTRPEQDAAPDPPVIPLTPTPTEALQ